jgi:hypothetical protein
MRTSFHHQSEAQPPNGRLTAATSPDTPSAAPASQSVSDASPSAPPSHSSTSKRGQQPLAALVKSEIARWSPIIKATSN